MHPNTQKLIEMADEARKLEFYDAEWPHRDFCYAVARESGELGEEDQSDNALIIAKRMLEELHSGIKWKMNSNEFLR